ncbi:MAG TPA: LacI family DNA-binding transcriptional regulator [Streptosporangiaceae bacterium]|nr:LacI family DNA-binding transcriptional regulator [Streptosporangiaceae bacterium]
MRADQAEADHRADQAGLAARQAGASSRLPTIRDVAERAGVSKSLVSLVLRGAGSVSQARRQAVLTAAADLGYRVNAAARSLSERRTHTVGVLLDDMRNPWFVGLLDGLNHTLSAHGLRMLMADAHLSKRAGQDLVASFLELRVDGVVAVGTLPDPSVLGLIAARLPTVVAGARDDDAASELDVVANDDALGGAVATEHLIGLGHRAIAHISGRGKVGELRRGSFEDTMNAHGLCGSAAIEPGDHTEEGGYRATVRLLSSRPRPTAIFGYNDISCVGALTAAEEMGLKVPRDLSVVGYDNTYIAQLRHLWLTTVDSAGFDVGRQAASCLVDRFNRPGRTGTLILTRPRLEVRGSTAAPPAGARGRGV